MSEVNTIMDSGERTKFGTGAVRDIQEGKGRCDLMPLGCIAAVLDKYTSSVVYVPKVLSQLDGFLFTKDKNILIDAITTFIEGHWDNHAADAFLDVAIHYEECAKKYGEHNWELGIPLHSFIDSGVRHLLKVERGDTDENHARAFLWNMLGALWTLENRPNMDDLPIYEWPEPNSDSDTAKNADSYSDDISEADFSAFDSSVVDENETTNN